MIAAEVFTVGLGIILTVALLLPTAYRAARRRAIDAAKRRHPSMRGKL